MGATRLLSVAGVTIAALVFAGCAADPTDIVAVTESPTPTPEPTLEVVGIDLECADVDSFVTALPGASAFVPRVEGSRAVYPGAQSVRQVGGLACEWSSGSSWVHVMALPEAAADFREARVLAETPRPGVAPGWVPSHVPSEVGDEAIRSCHSHGEDLASCGWSVLSGDVWISLDFSNLPLGLIEPGAGANGLTQQEYLPADGPIEAGAQAIVDAIVGAPLGALPERVRADNDACLARLAPDAAAPVLGVSAAEVRTLLRQRGPDIAASVSMVSLPLPYYAADRAGWAQCTAAAEDTELGLTIAPGAAELFAPPSTNAPYGVESSASHDGIIYSLTRVAGDDIQRVYVLRYGTDFPFDPSPLLSQFLD